MQPLPGSDSTGTWWVLHAATPPAQVVVHTQAGELLLVEQKAKLEPVPSPPPAMVAARATFKQFRAPPGLDPFATSDPWAEAAAARQRTSPAAAPASDSVQAIKAQLETSVLAKVWQAQVPTLDTEGLTASVEQSILAKLQPQLQDATVTAQAALAQVQALDGKVSEVSNKVDGQERSLREMFSEQIEELLGGKRQRQE